MTTTIDTLAAMTRKHRDRMEELKGAFPDDVRRLYAVYVGDTGASDVCGSILRTIHDKFGTIDPTEMFRLDFDNKAAALRLIELAASPFELSDDGLAGILTPAQIERLFPDAEYLQAKADVADLRAYHASEERQAEMAELERERE